MKDTALQGRVSVFLEVLQCLTYRWNKEEL